MDSGCKGARHTTSNPIREATASETQQSTNSSKIPQNSRYPFRRPKAYIFFRLIDIPGTIQTIKIKLRTTHPNNECKPCSSQRPVAFPRRSPKSSLKILSISENFMQR